MENISDIVLNKKNFNRLLDLGEKVDIDITKYYVHNGGILFTAQSLQNFLKDLTNLKDELTNEISLNFKELNKDKRDVGFLNRVTKITFENNFDGIICDDKTPIGYLNQKQMNIILKDSNDYLNNLFNRADESKLLVSYNELIKNYVIFQKEEVQKHRNGVYSRDVDLFSGEVMSFNPTLELFKYNENLPLDQFDDYSDLMNDNFSKEDLKELDKF